MSASLTRRTLGNIAWSAGSRGSAVALQLAANVILARNLSSLDYGIVGFAQIFVTFLALLSEFGLSAAAVQAPQLGRRTLITGFTLRLLLGAGALGLAIALAPLCALLLGEPAVGDVMKLLAAGLVINALAFVPSVLLLRALDYRRLAAAQLVGALVNAAVMMTLALRGFGYWSIPAALVASSIASAICLNFFVRERVAVALDRPALAYYFGTGKNLFLFGLLSVALLHLDALVVGRFAGPETLGYYALAFVWGAKLCELIATVLNNVLFPTFSRVQDDLPKLRAACVKSMQLVGFLAVGGYVTLFAASRDLLVHLLGAGSGKWLPALGALQILCLYGIVRSPLEPLASLAMGTGGHALLVRANILALATLAVLLYPALAGFGIEGVAAAVAASYATQYFVYVPALAARLAVNPAAILRPLAAPLAAGALVLGAFQVLDAARVLDDGLARLWLLLALNATAYVIAFGALTGGRAYRDVLAAVLPRRAGP